MKKNALLLLISTVLFACNPIGTDSTTVRFKVEDVTGTDNLRPFRVALIEESIPINLGKSPVRTIVEEFEPSVNEYIEFETELKRRDKFEYYLSFLPLDGHYSSGLIYNDFFYTEEFQCKVDNRTINSCHLKVEPVYHLSIRSINKASLPGDSIWLAVEEKNISFIAVHSGHGASPVSQSYMPYGHQTLHYRIYEKGRLIQEHHQPFFAKQNLDTLITIAF